MLSGEISLKNNHCYYYYCVCNYVMVSNYLCYYVLIISFILIVIILLLNYINNLGKQDIGNKNRKTRVVPLRLFVNLAS